jgi:hypothetical protein
MNLEKGGKSQTFILNGANLNKVNSIEALNAKGVTASFKILSATKLQVTLKAKADAKPGNYQLRLKDKKGQVINIPLSMVRVGIASMNKTRRNY